MLKCPNWTRFPNWIDNLQQLKVIWQTARKGYLEPRQNIWWTNLNCDPNRVKYCKMLSLRPLGPWHLFSTPPSGPPPHLVAGAPGKDWPWVTQAPFTFWIPLLRNCNGVPLKHIKTQQTHQHKQHKQHKVVAIRHLLSGALETSLQRSKQRASQSSLPPVAAGGTIWKLSPCRQEHQAPMRDPPVCCQQHLGPRTVAKQSFKEAEWQTFGHKQGFRKCVNWN